MFLEELDIYKLITQGTKESFYKALKIVDELEDYEIALKSEKEDNTLLHVVVNQAQQLHQRHNDVTAALPLLYRLALVGVNVNAQNSHGNTCLHLACFKPYAEAMCDHLVRLGADPGILNHKDCRVIHSFATHTCELVKGQAKAKSGIWNAIEREDIPTIEYHLKAWCRVVASRKKRELRRVANETGNIQVIKLITKYEPINEMVCAALAGRSEKVRDLVRAGFVDMNVCDQSRDVPKPILVAAREFGEATEEVVKVLLEAGADDGTDYKERLKTFQNAFETSPFYTKIAEGSAESILDAANLVEAKEVNVNLRSFREHTKGWTYLHYVVHRYTETDDVYKMRYLVRILYKLALAGIDVNARDSKGETVLISAGLSGDQQLISHVLRIGVDPAISSPDGRTLSTEAYKDKGKLVIQKKSRRADLPGLWVAVEDNKLDRTKRWLSSWYRVHAKKGGRDVRELAQSMGRTDLVKLLEEYEQNNEFVCAVLACDLKEMMQLLALGNGKAKVNSVDEFYHVGYREDRSAEYYPRPLIVSAVEYCVPEVVDFLLHYGADLSVQHEEAAPCGPTAFWAFRDHVDNCNTLIVAKHADVELQDERGATMLHRAVLKKQFEGKDAIMRTLLERGVNLAARDFDGLTARDYLDMQDIPQADRLKQVIDDHVLHLVANEETYIIENLLLDAYDHICDISGKPKKKVVTVRDVAVLKEFKEIIKLVDEHDDYRKQIDTLLLAAKNGDLRSISKIVGEKRCAYGRDKGGRTLMHIAILYQRANVVEFLIEQFPQLINSRDNLLRTPLHYCVCLKGRRDIWPQLLAGDADPNAKDTNNLNTYDYVRLQDEPVPVKQKPPGRRVYNYVVDNLIDHERSFDYGGKLKSYQTYRLVRGAIDKGDIDEVSRIVKEMNSDLTTDDLDLNLLFYCVEKKCDDILKSLINLGFRTDGTLKVSGDHGGGPKGVQLTLLQYAEKAGCQNVVKILKTMKDNLKEDLDAKITSMLSKNES